MEAERIAQIVTQHGDELLAQLGRLMLALKALVRDFLGGPRQFARHEQFLFVAAPIGRPDECQANGQWLTVGVPLFVRIGDHLERLAVSS